MLRLRDIRSHPRVCSIRRPPWRPCCRRALHAGQGPLTAPPATGTMLSAPPPTPALSHLEKAFLWDFPGAERWESWTCLQRNPRRPVVSGLASWGGGAGGVNFVAFWVQVRNQVKAPPASGSSPVNPFSPLIGRHLPVWVFCRQAARPACAPCPHLSLRRFLSAHPGGFLSSSVQISIRPRSSGMTGILSGLRFTFRRIA